LAETQTLTSNPILNDKDTKSVECLGSGKERKEIHKQSKFKYNFIEIAARLKAAGFSDKDLGYALGVNHSTVTAWKKMYPEFGAACKEGTESAVKYLVAKGLKGAAGYDYEEVETKYKTIDTHRMTPEGEPILKEIPVTRKVTKKHQKSDPMLLCFMLINLSKGEFRNTKYIEQKTTTVNVDVSAQLEADTIKRLAGKLNVLADEAKKKQIKSREVKPEEKAGAFEDSKESSQEMQRDSEDAGK